jgi:hypothetical protein
MKCAPENKPEDEASWGKPVERPEYESNEHGIGQTLESQYAGE